MLSVEDIKSGDTIYIVDTDKATYLVLDVISVFDDQRLKLRNPEITFEIEFDEIVDQIYLRKDDAMAVLVKAIFDSTNKYIRELTDGYYTNYFELDIGVEKYKNSHPDLFV